MLISKLYLSLHHNQTRKKMKPEFKIFKEGTTDSPITILSKNGELFDREAKIKKYLFLGFRIFDLDDKEIFN